MDEINNKIRLDIETSWNQALSDPYPSKSQLLNTVYYEINIKKQYVEFIWWIYIKSFLTLRINYNYNKPFYNQYRICLDILGTIATLLLQKHSFGAIYLNQQFSAADIPTLSQTFSSRVAPSEKDLTLYYKIHSS